MLKNILLLSFLFSPICYANELVWFYGTIDTQCAFRSNQPGILALNPNDPRQLATNVGFGTPSEIKLDYIGTPYLQINPATIQYIGSETQLNNYTLFQTAWFENSNNEQSAMANGMTSNWQSSDGAKNIMLSNTTSNDTLKMNIVLTELNNPLAAGDYLSNIEVSCF